MNKRIFSLCLPVGIAICSCNKKSNQTNAVSSIDSVIGAYVGHVRTIESITDVNAATTDTVKDMATEMIIVIRKVGPYSFYIESDINWYNYTDFTKPTVYNTHEYGKVNGARVVFYPEKDSIYIDVSFFEGTTQLHKHRQVIKCRRGYYL